MSCQNFRSTVLGNVRRLWIVFGISNFLPAHPGLHVHTNGSSIQLSAFFCKQSRHDISRWLQFLPFHPVKDQYGDKTKCPWNVHEMSMKCPWNVHEIRSVAIDLCDLCSGAITHNLSDNNNNNNGYSPPTDQPALQMHLYPGLRFWHLAVFCLLHALMPVAHSSMSSSQLSPRIPSMQRHLKLPGVLTQRSVKMGLQRFLSKWLFSTHSFTSSLHRFPFQPVIPNGSVNVRRASTHLCRRVRPSMGLTASWL